MIIELVGLPGSGKTTFAKCLADDGRWTVVSITGIGELFFYNVLFFSCHPVRFIRGLCWLYHYRGLRELWYTKFVNLFLVHNAKYMKAGKYPRAVIDQGHHQNIASLFDVRVSDEALDRYARTLPKPDLLCFFVADDETRTKRLVGRGYGARGEMNEDYREAWEDARARHFEHVYLSREGLSFPTETVTPDDEGEKLYSIAHARMWHFVLHGRMPTEKAHGLQIAKTIEALREKGVYVALWIPHRENSITIPVGEYYDILTPFPVRTFPIPNLLRFPRFFGQLRFWLDALGFLFVLAFTRTDREGVFFTRNPELAWLLKMKGTSAWYEAHTFPSSKVWLLKFFLAHIDGIIANSEGTANAFVKHRFSNVHIVRNGADIKQFVGAPTQGDARALLNLPKDKKIVTYVGAFYAWKGVPLLLETWEKYFGKQDDLLLMLVGGIRGDMEKYGGIEAYRRSTNVLLVPHVPAAKVPLYLIATDALVLPNTPTTEESVHYTSPIKLFEYMASGRPIIAADLPSIHEILSQEAGLFFRAGDGDALAAAIITTLRNLDEARIRASRARADVVKYSWVGRAQLLLNIVRGHTKSRVNTHAQFLKTITVGGILGVLYLTLIYVLTTHFGLWYAFSVAIAYAVIFVSNFLLLKLIFVGGERHVAHELSRYAALVVANFFVNEFITYILVEKLNMWYMLAQFLVVGVLAVVNFFIYRSQVFQTVQQKE